MKEAYQVHMWHRFKTKEGERISAQLSVSEQEVYMRISTGQDVRFPLWRSHKMEHKLRRLHRRGLITELELGGLRHFQAEKVSPFKKFLYLCSQWIKRL